MGLKAALSKVFAAIIRRKLDKTGKNALFHQQKTLKYLLKKGKNSAFGIDHRFHEIKNYDDFKLHVPVVDYEDIKPYIDRILTGEKNVLWPGQPAYLAKTSGTTSGVKYIPITKESMPEHIKSARNALLCYIHETSNADFIDGKMMFLQGSPVLKVSKGVATGRLSGIVAHHVPGYLQKNRLPSFETNCIEDWEQKVDAIVVETKNQDMRLISGIPPWCQMYFDRLSVASGNKKIKDIFPNFKLFVHGGVNYEPYKSSLEQSIGFAIDSIETYPASEGFIAFQDVQDEKGLLLQVDSGIFYEFIPADEFFNAKPTRISLKDIELGVNYAIILSTTAGLWGYNLGDTVKFVSKTPYKITVTGRIKHYISAFGEHVIGEEVEQALMTTAHEEGAEITEFTVAPQVNPPLGQLPFHEWFVEFSKEPADLKVFADKVDNLLQKKNIYYFDLIKGNVLKPLVIRSLKKDTFINYMRSMGKLGGQNKVPRLANDRKITDELKKYIV